MKTNSAPPRQNMPTGSKPGSAAERPRAFRFKTEDFEKHIDFLPREKRRYARFLFTKDPTGRWMKTDEERLRLFMECLDPKELEALGRITQENKMSMNPGRMSEAKTANLKDSGRFTPEPAPEAHRPAQGADLHSPLGSQEARPQSMDQDLYPPPADLYPPPSGNDAGKPSGNTAGKPSGNAAGKPESVPSKPERVTLAELFAAEDAGRTQGKPNSGPSKPNREQGPTLHENGGHVNPQSGDSKQEQDHGKMSTIKKFALGAIAVGAAWVALFPILGGSSSDNQGKT